MFRSILVVCILLQWSYIIESFSPSLSRARSVHSSFTKLYKKSKSPESKGFGKKVTKKLDQLEINEVNVDGSTDQPLVQNNEFKSAVQSRRPSSEEEIFQKYNIKNVTISQQEEVKKKKTKSPDDPEYAFGEDIITKIPAQTQAKIDSTLITLTFASLFFVVLTGIAISFGAFKVVFKDVVIDETMDNVISNILAPAFSPALGVFFFFSITFGLFKLAQISSSQTVYKE